MHVMAFTIYKVIYMAFSWDVNKLTTRQTCRADDFVNAKAMQDRKICLQGLGTSLDATEAIRVRDRVRVTGPSITPTN